MAGHQLVEQFLAEVRRELPEGMVDELADGLTETWLRHQRNGLDHEQAGRAAIAEFGTVRQVIDAFVANASGRRTARLLLVTGPAVGLCWGASLVMAKAWTWPIPRLAEALFAVALVSVVACLLLAATSTHSYRRTRLGSLGALALVVLDVAMLATILRVAPPLVWPMAIAIPASIVRLGYAVRSAPRRRFSAAR